MIVPKMACHSSAEQQQLECRQSLCRACHILACALLYLLLHCTAVC